MTEPIIITATLIILITIKLKLLLKLRPKDNINSKHNKSKTRIILLRFIGLVFNTLLYIYTFYKINSMYEDSYKITISKILASLAFITTGLLFYYGEKSILPKNKRKR